MARIRRVLLAVATLFAPALAQQSTQVLLSSDRNINMPQWQSDWRKLTPDAPTAWSIRKYVLHGGKQEGVDVILLDNGKLIISICPTRGMGILWAKLGDVRLGWDSPIKEIVHPRNMNLQMRGGLGWLEGFNELVVRCGLENTGQPGTDKFINNLGDEAAMELTVHGKIANIPASEVEVIVEKQPPYRLRVRGRVDERMFFGPKLELWTEVSTEVGSDTLRISDTLTNRGASEQEFQILYHCNFGRPMLEEGSTFLAAVERIVPFNANAAKGITSYDQYAGPKAGFIEQVYWMYPLADSDGKSMAMLQNKAKDRAVSITFSPKELPYLTLWKNTTAEEEGYVTGIEPGSGFTANRRVERKAGRVPKLAGGATRQFTLDFGIHVGSEAVRRAAARVREIQGSRKPLLEESPPKMQ